MNINENVIRKSIREKQDEVSFAESATLTMRILQKKLNSLDEAAAFYQLGRTEYLEALIDAGLNLFDQEVANIQPEGSEDESEELQHGVRYFLVNTNAGNDVEDHNWMIAEEKAAAFYEKWKYKINRIKEGDHILLYRSGYGIVAYGVAEGELIVEPHHHTGEENVCHSIKLKNFQKDFQRITAKSCKDVTKNSGLQFRHTVSRLNSEDGAKLVEEMKKRANMA